LCFPVDRDLRAAFGTRPCDSGHRSLHEIGLTHQVIIGIGNVQAVAIFIKCETLRPEEGGCIEGSVIISLVHGPYNVLDLSIRAQYWAAPTAEAPFGEVKVILSKLKV
jgi:hypothetical protein